MSQLEMERRLRNMQQNFEIRIEQNNALMMRVLNELEGVKVRVQDATNSKALPAAENLISVFYRHLTVGEFFTLETPDSSKVWFVEICTSSNRLSLALLLDSAVVMARTIPEMGQITDCKIISRKKGWLNSLNGSTISLQKIDKEYLQNMLSLSEKKESE